MRGFHKLRGNSKPYFPRHLIFVDTETTTIRPDEDVHYPKLIVGVAQYAMLSTDAQLVDLKECVFTDQDTFWAWVDGIADTTTDLHLYAHNWSFDFPILDGFTYLRQYRWRVKAIVDASPPIIIRYHRGGDKLTVIDSLNYFRQSLASMGKVVGQNKIKIDLLNTGIEELTAYCRGDVDILRKSILSLIGFVLEAGIGRLTHTVSSLALQSFTTQFMNHDIMIDGNERRVEVARKSYFGGRTECFRLGPYKGKFFLIDVNSMYPHVMRNNEYPTKAIAYYRRVKVDDLHKLMYRYCITAKCLVKTDVPAFPVKINGRTCFPVGEFWTYLSTPEIEYGLAGDMIADVDIIVVYEKAHIFTEYVDFYYKKRLEYKKQGNDMYQEFSKKLLNSLYGKFGQTGHEWEPTKLEPVGKPRKWEEYDVPTAKHISYMELDDVVYESVREPESRDSNPSIAAHVTAYGRILMQRTIDYIGREHCYYGDTDSLLIDHHGYKRMQKWLHPKSLGCWSKDGEYTEILIRGPKDYRFDSKEKIKGVKKSKVYDENGEQLYEDEAMEKEKLEYAVTNDGLYRQLQFTSLKWNIREGMPDQPVIRHVEKELKREYKKGYVDGDGVVRPYRLELSAST